MKNNILLIIGMHRSGTSLTAGWLHLCGLKIGVRLLGKGIGNLRGHFEDKDFFDIHEAILKENHNDYLVLQNEQIEVSEHYFDQIKNLINDKNSKNSQWGWKEPRTCLFLNSVYKKLIPNAKYLILYRPFYDVIDSMYRREIKVLAQRNIIKKIYHWAFNIQKSKTEKINLYLSSWIRYNEEILTFIKHSNSEDYILTGIKQGLVKNNRQLFDKITNWGFTLNYKDINDFYEMNLISNKDILFDCSPALVERATIIEEELKKLVSKV